jgi:Zn-dependent peptidase ImmA (M78 family)
MQEEKKIILNNSRKKELSDLAEFISNDYCPNGIVSPEIIAKSSDVTYNYGDYADCFNGVLEHDNGSFHIYLNRKSTQTIDNTRIRFSFAHELGHFFIDEHRNALIKGNSLHKSYYRFFGRNIIEQEADYFASCLLMPEVRFCDDIKNKKFYFDVIDFLRTQYKVSRTACLLRFADIGNHPIMVVYAENNIIKWIHPSQDFPFKWLINDNIVPINTVMGDYFNNNHGADVFKTEQVWAIDCFKNVRKEDIQRQFKEYCITYKNSALSVFWES